MHSSWKNCLLWAQGDSENLTSTLHTSVCHLTREEAIMQQLSLLSYRCVSAWHRGTVFRAADADQYAPSKTGRVQETTSVPAWSEWNLWVDYRTASCCFGWGLWERFWAFGGVCSKYAKTVELVVKGRALYHSNFNIALCFWLPLLKLGVRWRSNRNLDESSFLAIHLRK